MAFRIHWPFWVACALPVLVMLCVSDGWPRWLFMWLLAASIYFACKVLTWSLAAANCVPRWQQWAYLLAWPGMNAARFFDADRSNQIDPPTRREWAAAAFNLAVGGVLFWSARIWLPRSSSILLGWAGMIGTVLMLHFGSFHLLSCIWRRIGIDAPPLMNQPLRSTSVAEFWGRRWNAAFRDLTYQFLFRPLRSRLGATTALVVGFIISGMVHDLVISVPASGGYGRPTVFFTIQAAAILAERSPLGRSLGLDHGWRGRLFTGLVLLVPVRLLFHDPFVTKIAVPFMHALGAA
ncbi:MAG: membrane bound O-acyl transferase family-domain-containing protein [Planctomycetes bacterium]|nr:membrane bound O-acyl transferase family-domain-containing protein [Planctomycetota bacterium]